MGDSVDAEGCVLIDVARQSRNAGISVCGPGAKFSDIGELHEIRNDHSVIRLLQ